jgi:AcrR family transcriptional regulator
MFHARLHANHMMVYFIVFIDDGQAIGRLMDKPKTTRVSHDHWLKDAILLLAKEGFTALTVDGIAARIGVTRGSFYHHFKSRQSLVKKMLEIG